jgi:2-polyprenyl-3-methyl-5-hydroxy-6-metoxy-1,4-benzoquinol methylase
MELEKLTSCPICGNQNFTTLLTTIDYTLSGKSFTIQKCNHCTLGLTNPRPTLSDIAKYYQAENYISHTGGKKNLIDFLYRTARSYAQNWKRGIISRYQTKGSILDFGCGTGEFLLHMKNNGWSYAGVEPSPLARTKASENLKTEIQATLNETHQAQFDVITLWHVAEHLHDLTETIALLKSKLKKDGTIFIAVPNYESPDSNYYGDCWAGYDVPRHLWHFSKKAMTKLFKDQGFHIQQIVPMKLDALYISYLSEAYQQPSSSKFINLMKGCYHGLLSNLKAGKTRIIQA